MSEAGEETDDLDVVPKKKVRKRKSKNVIDDEDYAGEVKVQHKNKKIKVEPPKQDNPLLKWLNKSADSSLTSPSSELSKKHSPGSVNNKDITKENYKSSDKQSESNSKQSCSSNSKSSKPLVGKLLSKIDFSNLKAKLNAKLSLSPKTSPNLTPIVNGTETMSENLSTSQKEYKKTQVDDELQVSLSTPIYKDKKQKVRSAKRKDAVNRKSIKDLFQMKNSKIAEEMNCHSMIKNDTDIESDEHTEYYDGFHDCDDSGMMFISNKYECRKVVDSTDNESLDSFVNTPVKSDQVMAPPYSPLSPLCRKSPQAMSRSPCLNNSARSPLRKRPNQSPWKEGSPMNSLKSSPVNKTNGNKDLETCKSDSRFKKGEESPRKLSKNLFGTSGSPVNETLEDHYETIKDHNETIVDHANEVSQNETECKENERVKISTKPKNNAKSTSAQNEEDVTNENDSGKNVDVTNNSISDEDFKTPKKKTKKTRAKEVLSVEKSCKEKKSKKKESPNLNSSLLNYFTKVDKKKDVSLNELKGLSESKSSRDIVEVNQLPSVDKLNSSDEKNETVETVMGENTLEKKHKKKRKKSDHTLEQLRENEAEKNLDENVKAICNTTDERINYTNEDSTKKKKRKIKRNKTGQNLEKPTEKGMDVETMPNTNESIPDTNESSEKKNNRRKEKKRRSSCVEIRFDFESDTSRDLIETPKETDCGQNQNMNESKELLDQREINGTVENEVKVDSMKLEFNENKEDEEMMECDGDNYANNVVEEKTEVDAKHKTRKYDSNEEIGENTSGNNETKVDQNSDIINKDAACNEKIDDEPELQHDQIRIKNDSDCKEVQKKPKLKNKRSRGRPKKDKTIVGKPEETELDEKVTDDVEEKVEPEEDPDNDDKENQRRSLRRRKTHEKKELQEQCDNVIESALEEEIDERLQTKMVEPASLFKYFKKVDTLEDANGKRSSNVMKVSFLVNFQVQSNDNIISKPRVAAACIG